MRGAAAPFLGRGSPSGAFLAACLLCSLLGPILGSILLAPRRLPALDLEVDFWEAAGEVRPLHGGNCGPLQYGETLDLSAGFRELGIPLIRLHDCLWPNPDVVDIRAVFPDLGADPSLPESYDFRRTDDYIQAIVDVGAGIVYRLGESIEHTRRKYRVHPPPDPEKWARIAIHIIRHYNEGWADGFRHGIRYWEIWNEPENRPQMWTGTDEDYFSLYEAASRAIAERFPHLKVGGPSLGHTGTIEGGRFAPGEFLLRFLERCRDRRLPLHFLSWHLYTDDPSECVVRAKGIRETLDRFGFAKTESHLNEWNYLPRKDWTPLGVSGQGLPRQRFYEEVGGAPGAAFVTCVLVNLQDAPVDVANYYMSDNHGFGLFTQHGVPKKTFHAMKAFRRLLETPLRVAVRGGCPEGLALCAGTDRYRSRLCILVGNLRGCPSGTPVDDRVDDRPGGRAAPLEPIRISVPLLPWRGGSEYEILVVDGSRDLEKVREGRWPEGPLDISAELAAPAAALISIRPAGTIRASE